MEILATTIAELPSLYARSMAALVQWQASPFPEEINYQGVITVPMHLCERTAFQS